MTKRLCDFRWTCMQRLKEVFSDEGVLYSPINAVKTMRIIKLSQVCEFISYVKRDDDSLILYEELKGYLRKSKSLILNASKICPGVDTTILNSMFIELLRDELTDDEINKLFSCDENLMKKHEYSKKLRVPLN